MKRFVLLLRHGAVDRTQDIPDKEQPLKEGAGDIRAIANALAEHLELLPKEDEILIGKIWSGSYKHTIQTSEIVYETLKKKVSKFQPSEFMECNALDPDCFRPLKAKKDRQMVGQWVLEKGKEDSYFSPNKLENGPKMANSSSGDANAILIVGHAPQINWIAEKILRDSLPLANAELACIAINDSWWDRFLRRDRWLLWTIWDTTPEKTKELTASLYEKLYSKMKLAGVLGGLITGILVFLLKSLLVSEYLSKLSYQVQTALFMSTVCFFIALGLYLGTIYAYDRLMMPVRYWGERSEWKERRWLVERPPGSATWVIYQNMVRIWNWLFTPATVAVFLGLLTLAYAAFQPDLLTSLIVLLILILSVLYYRNFRPALGTDD
jgi:phosphohistidine phosphatase SixA